MNQITALRGLAIVFIVLFHLAPKAFPYGYYGVEVFLVITGFLLMRSYLKQDGQINLPEFVSKKVLRLFLPASCLVLLVVLPGLCVLDCGELLNACSSGFHALIGDANAHLAKVQSDYFAPDSSTNVFLHMWYLAVIIHVYILFGVGCLLARYVPRRVMVALLWLVGIGSFCWAYSWHLHEFLLMKGLPVWEQTQPVSHYMTLPRLWEPLAGMLLATMMNRGGWQFSVLSSRRSALHAVLTLLGLTALCWMAFFHGRTAARGALVVVLGTCLVIRYCGGAVWARWFCNPVLLWLGGISFSLYLVHMPLFAYFHSCFLREPEWYEMLLLGVVSVGVAWLFYHAIEKRPARWLVLVPAYAASMALCVAGMSTDGFRDYIHSGAIQVSLPKYCGWEMPSDSDLYRGLDREMLVPSASLFKPNVGEDATTKPYLLGLGEPANQLSFVLLGDSHAGAAYSGLNEACKRMGIGGVCLTTYTLPYWDWELPPLKGNEDHFYNRAKAEALMSWLRQHPEIKSVVLSQYWEGRYLTGWIDWDRKPVEQTPENYEASLRRFLSELKATGKEVIILAPTICLTQTDIPRFVRAWLVGKPVGGLEGISCTREQYLQQHATALSVIERLEAEGLCKVWRTLEYIPKDKPFCAYENGELLYNDDDHMSSVGSIRLFRWLQPQLEQTLRPAASLP